MAVHRNTSGAVAAPVNKKFLDDVLSGLSAPNKYLHSKYFYDAAGDRLFQKIMQCPEYYVTNAEAGILLNQAVAIANACQKHLPGGFDVVELGAGDATKSTRLLQPLFEQDASLTYYPIDISANVIELLKTVMPQRIHGLQVTGCCGEYLEMIHVLQQASQRSKLFLFLGANIGNFLPEEALEFLRLLYHSMKPEDLLLIGIDLKKDPEAILAAYNDAGGLTKAFNLNLLHRINRELGADFDVTQFSHFPVYNPETGACKSYLISRSQQTVHIGKQAIFFDTYEPIWMELSQKYTLSEVNRMAENVGFIAQHHFFDASKGFVDALWQKPFY